LGAARPRAPTAAAAQQNLLGCELLSGGDLAAPASLRMIDAKSFFFTSCCSDSDTCDLTVLLQLGLMADFWSKAARAAVKSVSIDDWCSDTKSEQSVPKL
jgi:hypothetical protein